MMSAEGSIGIPLEEFWEYVAKFHDLRGCEIAYGVPRIEGDDLIIDYAAGTECHPADWFKKPKAVTQWEELKKKKD